MFLNNVNTTNLKIVTGCVLFGVLVVFACAMMATGHSDRIDAVLYAELLAGTMVWAGISYKQYAKKRDTWNLNRPDPPAATVPEGMTPVSPLAVQAPSDSEGGAPFATRTLLSHAAVPERAWAVSPDRMSSALVDGDEG